MSYSIHLRMEAMEVDPQMEATVHSREGNVIVVESDSSTDEEDSNIQITGTSDLRSFVGNGLG